jgi:aerobic carbon-monoxide dehydrogenase large subunit
MPQTIGQPLRRKEDLRLVRGNGRYSDDVSLPGQAYAAILRSPHAHARIRGIDTAAARAMPGVLAVLTGADVTADGLKDVPHTPIPMKPPADILLANRDGSPHGYAPQALLPTDRVRYVGQQVVMVVAETLAQAKDATERVVVDYQPLKPIAATPSAAAADAPRLYDHTGNVCIDADVGDVAATEAAFARAALIARLDTWVNRVTGVPPSACTTRPATNTPCTPAPAAWCGRKPSLPKSSTSIRRGCAWNAAMSVAISVPGTRSFPSSRWWSGRPSASVVR